MSWKCPNPKCETTHKTDICPSCGWSMLNYLGDDDFYTFEYCNCGGIKIEDDPYPYKTRTCYLCGETEPNPRKLE